MHTTYLTINHRKVQVDCYGITTIAEYKALVVEVHGWESPLRAVLLGDPLNRVPMLIKVPSDLGLPLLTEKQWRDVRDSLIFLDKDQKRMGEILAAILRNAK